MLNKHRRSLSAETYLLFFLLAILIFMAALRPEFFSLNNIIGILNRYSYVLISAIGMNLIILTGNIDVSAGAIVSVVSVAIAALGKLGMPFAVLLPAAVLLGALVSFINSLFVTRFNIPAIVATLATSQLYAGILPILLEGSIYDLPESFTWFSFKAKIFGFIPGSLILMLVIAITAVFFMHYTRFSKKIYSVGNNKQSAYLAGISVNKVVTLCYVIAGALFGVSAVIIATSSQRVTTTMGSGLEMIFIAAVVLGGTSVSGGSGKIEGTILGALILSIIAPAANYLGISSDWSDAITGGVIIMAVVLGALPSLLAQTKRQKGAQKA